MAVCPGSELEIKQNGKKVLRQQFRHSHTMNLESRSNQNSSVHGNKHSRQRAVLFINHYVARGSHEVHRPNRSIVGSHVQRVIRHKKQINAKFKLRPAIFRHIQTGCLFGQVRVDDAPHGQGRWSSNSKESRCISPSLTETPRHPLVNESLPKKDPPTSAADKSPLAWLQPPRPEARNAGTGIGGPGVLDEDLGSSIAGTAFQYCEFGHGLLPFHIKIYRDLMMFKQIKSAS